MDTVEFDGFGVVILRRNDQLFVRYDAGHFAIQLVERKITEEQAQRLRQSEHAAYLVLLELERTMRKDG